jgi:basic membrane protein A
VASLSFLGVAHADQARVAGLFTQSVSQGNWDVGGYAGFKAMCEKYKFECTHIEHATYEKTPAILRNLASKGYDLIITHSGGYASAIWEVAPEFPDTEFVLYSWANTTKDLKNYAAWSMNWDEYGYVIGILAGAASKSGHIALVGGEAIPSTKETMDFISRGARKVNPDIQIDVSYIGSWTDVAKGKEIGLQAIERGADFLIPIADTAGAGVQQAAEENGKLTMGEYIDQSPSFPKSIVTSTLLDYVEAFDEIGEAYTQGKLDGQIVQLNIAMGHFTLHRPFQHVSPAIEEQVIEAFNDIGAGKVKLSE